MAPAGSAAGQPLTTADLDPVVALAERAWVGAGATPTAFSGLTVGIGDLDGPLLGIAGLGAITIDTDGAGWGWTVTGGQMDLFTVVLHELGHVLGLEHGATESVMDDTLDPGAIHQLGERKAAALPARGELRGPGTGWIVGTTLLGTPTILAARGQAIRIGPTAATRLSAHRLRSGHGAHLLRT